MGYWRWLRQRIVVIRATYVVRQNALAASTLRRLLEIEFSEGDMFESRALDHQVPLSICRGAREGGISLPAVSGRLTEGGRTGVRAVGAA